MTAHTIDIISLEVPELLFHWLCSCGERGSLRTNARSARTGGQRHVAAMERGRDPFAVLPQPGKGGARTTDGNMREIAKHERRAAIARGVMRRGEARGFGAGEDGEGE